MKWIVGYKIMQVIASFTCPVCGGKFGAALINWAGFEKCPSCKTPLDKPEEEKPE